MTDQADSWELKAFEIMKTEKQSIYERVTDQVIQNLEAAGSWKKLWAIQQPISLNKHVYRGINFLLLSMSKYNSPVWGTFNQVRANGGHVMKGEKSTLVVFWKKMTYTKKDEKTGDEKQKQTMFLRYYNVFNTEQCEFDEKGQAKIAELAAEEHNGNSRHIEADEIINTMSNPPDIMHGKYNPCYIPSYDQVRMPSLSFFKSSEAYYDALFHEVVHSTGHKKRLDRFEFAYDPEKHEYSKEELVAELGSAFLCTIAGIDHDMENTAAYIRSWLKVLKSNPTWITWAAARAQKASEFILESKNVEVAA